MRTRAVSLEADVYTFW